MPHIVGKIEKVHHNYSDQQNKPLPDDKVTHKFKIDDELYVIRGKKCPSFIQEGKTVSFSYNTWSPPGKDKVINYVLSNEGTLLIQEMVNQEKDLDDTLKVEPFEPASNTDFEPHKLENQGLNINQKKSQEIFCIAIAKSAIEAKELKPTKEELDKFMLDMKIVYNKAFS